MYLIKIHEHRRNIEPNSFSINAMDIFQILKISNDYIPGSFV